MITIASKDKKCEYCPALSFLIWIRCLKIDSVVCCTDFKALWDKFTGSVMNFDSTKLSTLLRGTTSSL